MPYSDQELEEIERDPERLRAWWWHMAMHHKRLARKYRERSRSTGESHPVTNYRPQFEEGFDLVRWARVLESVSGAILENMDALVESTLVKDEPAADR